MTKSIDLDEKSVAIVLTNKDEGVEFKVFGPSNDPEELEWLRNMAVTMCLVARNNREAMEDAWTEFCTEAYHNRIIPDDDEGEDTPDWARNTKGSA